jgi:hypothetical protein
MVGVSHDGMILSGGDAASLFGIWVFYHFICSSYPHKNFNCYHLCTTARAVELVLVAKYM